MANKIKSLFMAVLVVGTCLIGCAKAYASCPEGYKCIPDEQAKETAETLKLHNCMIEEAENGEITLDWKPNQVTITEEGQVFAKEDLVADLRWCSWYLQLTGKSDVLVHRQESESDDWGFRLRVKLGVAWLPTYVGGDLEEMLEVFLAFEPFHLWDWHIQTYAGLKSFGLSVGLDLTRNMDVFAGVGLGYRNADIVPVAGISLSFN